MPNQKSTDDLIKERLCGIFPDANIARRVLELVVTRRPPGTSRKSYFPYYREHYALQIKSLIDKQIVSKDSIIYPWSLCDDWKCSQNTLYMRVNQSIKFLIEQMDPTGIYNQWHKIILVHREHPPQGRNGICIDVIPELRKPELGNVGGLMIDPKEDGTPQWRLDMDRWLEGDKLRPFSREGLCLSLDSQRELKVELNELKGIMFDVTAFKIQIMKVNI